MNLLGSRVFAAMSGGVDSSVAAYLLKKQGRDVTGVFIRSYNIDGCQDRDAEDARRAAERIKIPFYVWNFEEEYKKRVVEYMVDGYRRGLTPNPDVMCNKEIKFGLFYEKALSMGADYVATGHYVRKLYFAKTGVKISPAEILRLRLGSAAPAAVGDHARRTSNSFSQEKVSFGLGIARDTQKDQSYFLWTLTQEQLAHCLFPIGDYIKSEVRAVARRAGLPTAEKKDSQGICFLGKVTLEDFLKRYIPEKRGAVRMASGRKIGEHRGAHFYTIGQRHFEIMNRKGQGAHSRPLYVAEKNVAANMLIVAEGEDNSAFYKKEVALANMNFTRPVAFDSLPSIVYARVRYRQPLQKATLFADWQRARVKSKWQTAKSKEQRIGGKGQALQSRGNLVFAEPAKFIALGQSAVFYTAQGEMLGGGVIR